MFHNHISYKLCANAGIPSMVLFNDVQSILAHETVTTVLSNAEPNSMGKIHLPFENKIFVVHAFESRNL